MNLTHLRDKPVEWLKGGPEEDVVVSSRIRLARNVDGYPFMTTASARQKAELERLLRNALTPACAGAGLTYLEVHELDTLGRNLLLERRLISRQHAEADWVRGVAFDAGERLSILVNEEDHVRIQSVRGGLRLQEAFERADHFDDIMSRHVPFAFSDQYGYLTACPTNVGTGLRASVMVHLPALSMAQEMNQVLQLAQRQNLTLRGGYGEGTYGAGDFYQVSNKVTLGISETEILETAHSAARQLILMERKTRERLHNDDAQRFEDHIWRAYQLLCSAATISSQEALNLLSQVRMGLQMQVLTWPPKETVNDLFLLTLPAHLQTMEEEPLDGAQRDQLRADFVSQRLSKT